MEKNDLSLRKGAQGSSLHKHSRNDHSSRKTKRPSGHLTQMNGVHVARNVGHFAAIRAMKFNIKLLNRT